MTSNCKARRKKEFMGPFNGPTGKWVVAMSLLAALFASSTALAGWNAEPEWLPTQQPTEQQHPTWIYTPDRTLGGSDKHGLMVVLPGCYQTHDQIKKDGNLETAADDFGLVMAVPFVTEDDAWYAPGSEVYCWDYDRQLSDEHRHLAEIIALTEELKKRTGLNIDSNHVYVVGLSSGGALALKLGCKAPDVFAGIGAIAGPSVGSNQGLAALPSVAIQPTTDDTAVSTCKSLAGGRISSFNTQIASIAYGNMDASMLYHRNATGDTPPDCNEIRDEDGPKALPTCGDQTHPGQNCVASIKWSDCNIKALQKIYNTGDLGPRTDVQGGRGIEQTASADGKTRLSLLVIDNVGHAWPAGRVVHPEAGPLTGRYIYIAQQGLNYPEYIAKWLTEHSVR